MQPRGRGGELIVAVRGGNGPAIGWRFERVDGAFDDPLGVGWHFQVVRAALDQFKRPAAQQRHEQERIEFARKPGGEKRVERIAPEHDGDRQTLTERNCALEVVPASLMRVPMHGQRIAIDDLQRQRLDGPDASFRVAREDAAGRDRSPRLERPASQRRQFRRFDVAPESDHLLAPGRF